MDSEFCGESGFCYIPQKNVNVFLLARNEHGWIPKKSLGLQLRSVQFFYSPCGSWVPQRHGQNLRTEFGDLAFWLSPILDSSLLLSSGYGGPKLCPLVLQTIKSGFQQK